MEEVTVGTTDHKICLVRASCLYPNVLETRLALCNKIFIPDVIFYVSLHFIFYFILCYENFFFYSPLH